MFFKFFRSWSDGDRIFDGVFLTNPTKHEVDITEAKTGKELNFQLRDDATSRAAKGLPLDRLTWAHSESVRELTYIDYVLTIPRFQL